MPKTSRKTDWIFQRPGSANWWIKLRSDGKRTERSLGTSDRERAVKLACGQLPDTGRDLCSQPTLSRPDSDLADAGTDRWHELPVTRIKTLLNLVQLVTGLAARILWEVA